MFRKIILLFIITGCVKLASAQAAVISGIVRDDKGNILQGASLTITNSNQYAITNASGEFRIAFSGAFPVTIEASYVGYASVIKEITAPGAYELVLDEVTSFSGVTIIGSRNRLRTNVNSPLPVTIIPAGELARTGQTELGQQLQFTEPSFQSAKYGINGSLGYADYATLRGMSPDQLLVTVNGKRRHQFSIPHIGFSISRGMVVTDLNAIPFLALDRTEVLKDGAAAQYGSDAIAGIVNLRLKETINQGTLKTQVGTTAKGDGTNYMAALNYGFGLKKENSFFNFTLMHQTLGETNRSDPYTGTIYSSNREEDDNIRAIRGVHPANDPFKVGVFGASEVKANQFFYNTAYPLNDQWRLYSFGGLSHKQAVVYGFFRNAIPGNANSNPAIYPDGFTPEFPSKDRDYSVAIGIDKTTAAGWNMDFSASFGRNAVHRYARQTVNASMGAGSPTEFYVGFSSFNQLIADATISRSYKGLWGLHNANFAFGSQLRIDEYVAKKGDENSFRVGPLALTENKAPGVQGIAATAPQDEAREARSNIGAFADLELDITEKWMIAGAARFENYSDFGANVSGKLATLYKIIPGLHVRGSVNRGFRAPSLQQVYNSATSTLVQAGQIRYTKQYRSDDPFLREIGISYPKPEIATSYNAGLTFRSGGFHISADAYLVRVNDKIIISEALSVNNIEALRTRLEGTGIQSISFFTNHVNTLTRGIDLSTGYQWHLGGTRVLSLNLGATFNHTEAKDIKSTPEAIQAGTAAKVAIIDTINIALIETAQPRQKIVLSAHYLAGKFQAQVRATYFGKVAAWERSGGQHVVQEFSGKTLADASVSYLFFKKLQLSAGANNIGNVYPDRVLPTLSAYGSGQSPFNRNVNQFGFAGAFYYAGLTLSF